MGPAALLETYIRRFQSCSRGRQSYVVEEAYVVRKHEVFHPCGGELSAYARSNQVWRSREKGHGLTAAELKEDPDW